MGRPARPEGIRPAALHCSAHPQPDVLARTDLSTFVIRYVTARGDVNQFNRTLLDQIHRDGRCMLNGVILDGAFGLRGCVMNFRANLSDAQLVVNTVAELGDALAQGI